MLIIVFVANFVVNKNNIYGIVNKIKLCVRIMKFKSIFFCEKFPKLQWECYTSRCQVFSMALVIGQTT